jgi:GNAT superfamily N-acetyltransferase
MNEELIIRDAELDDINTIGYLAYQVWPLAYKNILTLDQLQYMLNRIYSPASLRRQMIEEHHHFLIAELSEEPVGFASYGSLNPANNSKLHKLYVRNDIQGKGLGKALLDQVIENCVSAGTNRLFVNVNRHNKAISFYEKAGFKIIREEDVDIGNGYFMNDFVMEKLLNP